MPKIKNILIFIAIGAVIVFGYILFVKSSPSNTPSLVSSSPTTPLAGSVVTATPDEMAAQDFLNLLLSVKNIKLNDAIFSDKAFSSLVDTPVDLTPDGNEGRMNPFAPIGFDTAPQQQNTPAIIPTVTPAPDLTPTTPPTKKTTTGATTKP